MASFDIVVVPPRSNAIDDEGPDGLDGGEASGRSRRHDVQEREKCRRACTAWGERREDDEEEEEKEEEEERKTKRSLLRRGSSSGTGSIMILLGS